jgi:hypothetical protein
LATYGWAVISSAADPTSAAGGVILGVALLTDTALYLFESLLVSERSLERAVGCLLSAIPSEEPVEESHDHEG